MTLARVDEGHIVCPREKFSSTQHRSRVKYDFPDSTFRAGCRGLLLAQVKTLHVFNAESPLLGIVLYPRFVLRSAPFFQKSPILSLVHCSATGADCLNRADMAQPSVRANERGMAACPSGRSGTLSLPGRWTAPPSLLSFVGQFPPSLLSLHGHGKGTVPLPAPCCALPVCREIGLYTAQIAGKVRFPRLFFLCWLQRLFIGAGQDAA